MEFCFDPTICLDLMSIIASTYMSFRLYKVAIEEKKLSQKQQNLSDRINKQEITPYLYPIADKFIKEKWKRFYQGGVRLSPVVTSSNYDTLSNDKQRFMQRCNQEKHYMRAYFDYLGDEVFLMLNANGSNNNFFVEHHNVTLTLQNFGALITKIHIYSVDIWTSEGQKLNFNEVEDNFYTDIIPRDSTIEIVIDEVLNSSTPSTCAITEEIYNNLKDYDLFKGNVPQHLAYKKYEIKLLIWNQYDDVFKFLITIEKNGNRFYRRVEEVNSFE
ncbi:hypothetical protein [uncultured Bacteroides sp.]|uniref:hypothetical protein n=1 Tax=uncultured Bacteroides sp. TaxID=162156 RepID=UPI00260D7E1C|nr:hypothetical protein [uncultured Bacteroides sp.]